MKYRMFSSVNIDATCISSLSSSVYFSWVLDKNYWRSSIAYHVFVNSATFFSGMRPVSKMVALNMAAMELMVLAGCSCVFVWAF